jgi:hypothetical protein
VREFFGQPFRLAYFTPIHGLNPEVERLYKANRLAVVRQVKYDPSKENSLALVLDSGEPMPGARAGAKRAFIERLCTWFRSETHGQRSRACSFFNKFTRTIFVSPGMG